MPYQFPRRAVSCFDSPPRLKMNNALAAMYAMVMRLVFIQCPPREQQRFLQVPERLVFLGLPVSTVSKKEVKYALPSGPRPLSNNFLDSVGSVDSDRP